MQKSDFGHAVGACLRAVRQRRGLTLRDVELQSSGRWRAAVVGSYERAERSVTVTKLADLAAFYDVAISDLLPRATPGVTGNGSSLLTLAVYEVHDRAGSPETELDRYAAVIRAHVGGKNNELLTIWPDGLRILAALCDMPAAQFAAGLARLGTMPDPTE